jgi:branched-chain amino acid transport system substrate-binding protein
MKRQRTNTITRRGIAAALGISVLGAASFAAIDAARAQAPKTVKIAVIVPLSGAWARQGQLVKMGADTAAAEINAAGGIKALGGAKIEIVALDAGDSAERRTPRSVSSRRSRMSSAAWVPGSAPSRSR